MSALALPVQRKAIQFSPSLHSFAMLVAVLVLLTSSFDVFLILNAGGNYRFCQIIAPALVILAIIKARWGRKVPTLGIVPLGIWFLAQVLFIPVTSFWPKSLAYCMWLLLNIGLMFAYVQLFSDNRRALLTVLRWYVYSFGLIAAFGIIQFILPLVGIPGPLVKQWWIAGSLARANGFSYEPSYFATYLLIGFVFVSSLRRSRSALLSSRALLGIWGLTAVGIVVSSSRMGIVFLLIDVFLAQSGPWLSVAGDIGRSRIVPSKLRRLLPSLALAFFVAALLAGAVTILENRPAITLMFLNGTGVSGTAAHSVIEREDSLEETVAVFLEHPVIGRSLGGVSSAIAEGEGETIHSFEDSKNFEGMSVFAEILAASGIIGVVPFLCFLAITIWKPLALARTTQPFYSSLLRGLVRSLVFAWAILQFNQNVLRPYLWIHLAILATVYAAAHASTPHTPSR